MEATMTMILLPMKCVVDAVVLPTHSVQTHITTSSTQLETRAPRISLQMTATDNLKLRHSLLKSFAVPVEVEYQNVSGILHS